MNQESLNEFSKAHENTVQDECDAFFALPRKYLYLGALGLLAVLAALFSISFILMQYSRSALSVPLYPLAGFIITARLCRSRAGRGCLRSIGLGRIHNLSKLNPKAQLMVWAVLIVVGVVVAFMA